MDSNSNVVTEEWICKKLNIAHDNLDDIKTLSLPGTYHEKISHLGNSLFRFTRLKELDLSRNTLVSLEGLESLKLLEKLNLYYNNIGSIKDLERLKYNTALVELDLRLNPVTKEENDYRLYLINILPSLRVLDDRSIRESERQMAAALYHKIQAESRHNGKNGMDSAVVSRVKSVSNIAKRSAGLTDDDDIELNLKPFESESRLQKSQEFSSGNLRDIIKGYHYNDNDFLNKTKSCSMLNLRSINNNMPRLSKQKSVHFNEVDSYYDLNSYRSCSDNHFNMNDESEHYTNFKTRANFTPNPHYEDKSEVRVNDHEYLNEENKSQIYVLLDLVDRYWNGSKSLHKNQKFLNTAKQILNESGPADRFESNYQLKVLQEENRRLNYQLGQKKNEAESDSYKGLLSEIDNLKKKYVASQEEIKNLRKELAEKSDKQKLKEDALSSMETQNGNMKRDIEIMKIKLKQYEQLQQLTTMLQESHKSLVSTNEHLLQEINIQKQFSKSGHNQSRNSYHNDMDIYGAANYQIQDNLMQQMLNGQDSKVLMRKQFEQMTNGNQGRYAYPGTCLLCWTGPAKPPNFQTIHLRSKQFLTSIMAVCLLTHTSPNTPHVGNQLKQTDNYFNILFFRVFRQQILKISTMHRIYPELDAENNESPPRYTLAFVK
ncbi:centrosomal of 72 kDa [Brachionus plicatilis]|uniref:Centrosomal of 72 kDa n=1 Tax=Brachionus plicatilis TaxID=10195 RepID=A0A3M7RLD0_BRAPC|nr:centrosomal of 72 kDa [Brachionus plicatilis]